MSDLDHKPYGVMELESPSRINHVFTAEGWLGLEIDHALPGEARPITVRVTITKDQFLLLLAEFEATRQQFGFPLPAIFWQQQTRQ